MKRIGISSIALSMAIVLAGCSANTASMEKRMRQSQRAIPVEVKQAVLEEFSLTVSLSGRLAAKEQLDLTPKGAGRIAQIMVRVGDTIKAGQVIAKLDDAEGQVQLQRAQASLLAAKARYNEAKAGTRVENLEQSKNLVADAENKYNAAKRDYERVSTLFKEGALSAAEVEKAKLQLDSATTSLQNQKEKLKLDQQGPTQTSIEAAEAQYKQAEADAALARLSHDNLAIKSPIDGIIGAIPVTTGSAVSSNTVVAQIVNLSTMKVQTHATESQVHLFQNDQKVSVLIPSIGLKTEGKIISVSPLADSSKSFPVEIEVANQELKAKAGMIASVEMKADPRKAIVVPREAVISTNQQNYLYVVEEEKAKQVKVEVGQSDGKRMEILSGLNGGEQIVVKGQNTLVPNAPVIIFDKNKPDKSDKKIQPKG